MTTDNDLWKLEKGWLAGYTEDRELIRRIKRYKKDWRIMADYFKYDRLVGVQFKIPIEQRRPAERMFQTTIKGA
ncbi:hypothetical protein [Heyndrickxia coagulans]|uniref:Uncharacterized protein n=1 Tax=Heyndrickxia coagulans TaxID=1398 RepID=A0A150K6L3_HEYCO|nr:hypothetical protein [Heyndrickxia coagulans]KYC65199.1 hypothetical protein B4099_0345 [Heyndrickxia coagulans]